MKPNFVFVVADDLGYADLGCYGGREASFGPVSPRLDRLASQGIRFTQGYANSPVCSPTRFALITGRYQYRLRGAAEEPIRNRPRAGGMGLPPDHPTIPSLLRGAGYHTALIGKWHLGYPPEYSPLLSGYEEFFGSLSGGTDYFEHVSGSGERDLWEGEKEDQSRGYTTDLLTERAIRSISEQVKRDKPFFLSLHYTAPHWPWQTRADAAGGPPRQGGLFDLSGGNIDIYRQMIHHMDEGIGRIADVLESLNALDDTLIIFTSDNGGERYSDNWPLVGGKMDLTEGGIRVPWIAHWPRRIRPGRVTSQHCLSMDWAATVLDAARVVADPAYPLDGHSLLSVLSEEGSEFARTMYWRMNHRQQRALRQGRWKYLRVDDNDYLFDVDTDERERANLKAFEPARLVEMVRQWDEWNATMPEIPADACISLAYGEKDMPSR